jgi:hypothetical protein
MDVFIGIIFIAGAVSISWFKGNLRFLAGLEWEPWVYWLCFSLPQTYLSMYGYWKLMNWSNENAWKVMILTSSTAFLIQISLNTMFWGANYRAIFGLFLVILGGIIAR